MFFFVIAVLLLLLTTQSDAADAANGKALAQRWCASCHIVSSDQREGSPDTPPFSHIGGRPDFNAGPLALFLLEPHPKMPSMSLTRVEAADIAAYIATLSAVR